MEGKHKPCDATPPPSGHPRALNPWDRLPPIRTSSMDEQRFFYSEGISTSKFQVESQIPMHVAALSDEYFIKKPMDNTDLLLSSDQNHATEAPFVLISPVQQRSSREPRVIPNAVISTQVRMRYYCMNWNRTFNLSIYHYNYFWFWHS